MKCVVDEKCFSFLWIIKNEHRNISGFDLYAKMIAIRDFLSFKAEHLIIIKITSTNKGNNCFLLLFIDALLTFWWNYYFAGKELILLFKNSKFEKKKTK